MKLKGISKKSLFDILALITTLLTTPLFLYKLGQSSLISWDEAWYGEVARNILKTASLINLTWDDNPYFDHPPTGYWLMALIFKIFGVNEFWTRFPSAFAGIASIFLIYLLGKKLFHPLVGLASAIALSSAIWFVFRARSGNLDTILTMFFLLTLLLAVKTTENKKFLLPFTISLSLLFLTKTMVPFTIIPALFLIFYRNKLYSFKDLILPALLFLSITGGWFISQIIKSPGFIQKYLDVGLRGVSLTSTYLTNLNLAQEYLHSGIGRWFWPGILSLALSIFLIQKRFFILILFFVSFLLPVIFSPKIQIWHLIPLFPILILIYFGFTFSFLEKYLTKWKFPIYGIILIFSSYIYFNQVKIIWYQFIDIPAFVSDEAILSKEAGKYPQKLFVDGEYRPAALFYSEKGNINQAPKNEEDFISMINSEEDFLLITNQWRLENPKISAQKYQILKKDRDKVLILHTKF
ncbi:MAG: glycosyltransferase family 39 protein [Candidatus Daviesbacteria bacterium]|nr:glycosyltransferase family 39 protein [Candidatus Daviesbacteria bacterium]